LHMKKIELSYPNKKFKMKEIWIDLYKQSIWKIKEIKIKAIQILSILNSLKFWNSWSKQKVKVLKKVCGSDLGRNIKVFFTICNRNWHCICLWFAAISTNAMHSLQCDRDWYLKLVSIHFFQRWGIEYIATKVQNSVPFLFECWGIHDGAHTTMTLLLEKSFLFYTYLFNLIKYCM